MYRAHRRRPANGERESPSIWDSSEAWAACAKALREYDEDMIQDWKEEIDTLLVFAGLFSAVVTAFNIESYQLLQQQPEDSVTAILIQISSQLNSFSVNQNFINATTPANAANLPPFQPTAFAVRLNTLWFSSLVCGLLSASLGLLVKQWLREYLAGSSNISRESIRIRQYRYEGLRSWYVPEIILCLPILLQAALALFFVGLLDLLWTLHPIVATVVTAIVAVSMLFAATTSLLPPLYADCPYKSPQSWVFCIFAQSAKRSAAALASHLYARLYKPVYALPNAYAQANPGAATPDPFASRLDLPTSLPSRVSEMVRTWLHHLSLARTYSNWKEREKLLTETGRRAAALDDATLAGADEMFMDDTFLHVVVRPCMRDIAPRAALRCVDRILLRRAPRVLNDLPYWELARTLHTHHGDTGTLTLMHLLLDVLHRLNARRQCEVELDGEEEDGGGGGNEKEDARRRVLLTMHRLLRAIPGPAKSGSGQGADSQTHALFRRMFEVLAGVLAAEVGHAEPERFVRERSFNLMLKLFQRFQDVGPSCIMAFCAYSKLTRAENAPYRFVQACFMVIRASAALARDASRAPSMAVTSGHGHNAPEPAEPAAPYTVEPHNISSSEVTLHSEPLSMDDDQPDAEGLAEDEPDDYGSVRPAVLKVLDDLEGFLSAPVAKAAEFRPTTAMLAECAQAVLALAIRDRQAISQGLVAALSDMVGVASSASARAAADHGYVRDGYDSCRDRQEREDQEVNAARQAMRLLRRMYGITLYGRDGWRYYA
ncbi:hypothetical protein C8Q76DRAFT_696881 [Earliella scabrosa]|nr:hypothetical protein C8Q76DRAFT_696881 [Earliella scabrosa]